MSKITYIDQTDIVNKRVLLRVDFNVSLDANNKIADDMRIVQALPTIQYLLNRNNKLILVSHLGNPKGRDLKYSLKVVSKRLQEYLPQYTITLVNDFRTQKELFKGQKEKEIIILENIRFYPEEKANDLSFAKELASLVDVYVNDAFGVSHRANASLVAITSTLPSYGGLLMKKEIEMISRVIQNPQKPFIAIIGGAKISTKISLIGKLTEIADSILIGGALANTFFCGKGYEIGASYCELAETDSARKLLDLAKQRNIPLVLPSDVIVGLKDAVNNAQEVKKITQLTKDDCIYDIGPETQAKFGSIIHEARTIVWNGPLGYIENPVYRRGTDFVYYSITQNTNAVSVVGGGDTLAAISKKEYLDKITHISTGGGALLEFIEKGTLPAIEALK